MTLTELVTEINFAHKGNNRAPAEGTDKWDRTVSIVNRKLREWARDPKVGWNSLFEERNVGTLSTSQTVELDEDVHKLSDWVYVRDSDDQERRYTVVQPNRRGQYRESNSVYVSGNPKVLNFIDSISVDDQMIGADIIAPLYFLPEELTAGTDDIYIDSPEWLIYATAAELARNDPAKDDQFSNLVGMANEFYSQMVDNNNVLPYGQPMDIPVDVQRTGISW
jgi:hypothetical protein